MATAKQIIALLSSHVQGDEDQFLSIALQVAASEARRGRKEIADELRRLVEAARQGKAIPPRDGATASPGMSPSPSPGHAVSCRRC